MIANTLEDDMILVIFGSNLIERAGLNLDHTKRLCQAIFRGEHYEMTERSGPYEQRSQGWLQAKHAASGEGEKHQIRQRAEVVQHVLALRIHCRCDCDAGSAFQRRHSQGDSRDPDHGR